VVGEEGSRRRGPCGVEFDADERRGRISGVHHPRQSDATSSAGLPNSLASATLGQHDQQTAVFRSAGLVEALIGCEVHSGAHQRWEITNSGVRRVAANGHGLPFSMIKGPEAG